MIFDDLQLAMLHEHVIIRMFEPKVGLTEGSEHSRQLKSISHVLPKNIKKKITYILEDREAK